MPPVDPVIVVALSQLRGIIHDAVSTALRDAIDEMQASTADVEEWWDNRRLMSELGISRATAARWRAEGLLPYSKVGQAVYYRVADVHALLESRMRRG